MTDIDAIMLAACYLAEHDDHHWAILSDWLASVAARAETGDTGVDHDYAVTFARALFAEETA